MGVPPEVGVAQTFEHPILEILAGRVARILQTSCESMSHAENNNCSITCEPKLQCVLKRKL